MDIFIPDDRQYGNCDIFETKEAALKHALTFSSGNEYRIRPAIVRNAYWDGDGWNYEDYSDTFTFLQVIELQ